jgi:hypothetical protein
MTSQRRNLWIWAGVILVAIFLWWHVAGSRIHMVNELAFLGYIALAAGVLSALYWWDISAEDKSD